MIDAGARPGGSAIMAGKTVTLTRETRQRRSIHAAFVAADRPLAPAEVLDIARPDCPGLGLATVYRTIKRMLDDRDLEVVELPGQPARYELAGKHHHHHFHCRSCGSMYELEGCPPELGIDLPSGFRLEDHEIILYGRCEQCS